MPAGGIAAAQTRKKATPAQPALAPGQPTQGEGQRTDAGSAGEQPSRPVTAELPSAAAAHPAQSGGPGARTGAVPAARASAAGFYGQQRKAAPALAGVPQVPEQAVAGGKASGPRARLEAKLGLRAKGGVAAAGGPRPGGGGTRPAKQLVVPPGTSAFEAAFGAVVDSLDVRDCSTR